MLQKLYSIISRRNKETCHQKPQKMTALQRHWLDAMLGKRKQFLPLPPEAELEITTIGSERQQELLNGIHKRLSTLEEKILGKSYPLDTELYQPMETPNAEVTRPGGFSPGPVSEANEGLTDVLEDGR